MNIKIGIGDWSLVKESALTTIHKSSIKGKEVSSNWKLNILRSEHSPLREFSIRVKLVGIKRWIADQLVRHTVGVNSYMGTMRPDRGSNTTRAEQTMETETELLQCFNAESFINMCRTRLCGGCVSRETRLLVERIVSDLKPIEPEIAFMCVPPCIYRGACNEKGFTECSFFDIFVASLPEENRVEILTDIDKRYLAYHKWSKK